MRSVSELVNEEWKRCESGALTPQLSCSEKRCNEMRSVRPGFPTSRSTCIGARSIDDSRFFASLRMTVMGEV
jgi:hypothetical protein